MKNQLPRGLIVVAIFQFIGPLMLPPATLKSISPVLWGIIVAIFALLGVNLLRRRAWSRIATIFLQGFNIIIRLLVAISHAIQGGQAGNPVDAWLVGTALASMVLSAIILYYVDLPDIQVIMQ